VIVLNMETRARKKQKRSIERKQLALSTCVESFEETYGPTTSWIDKSKARKNPEHLREALLKGINELKFELQQVNH